MQLGRRLHCLLKLPLLLLLLLLLLPHPVRLHLGSVQLSPMLYRGLLRHRRSQCIRRLLAPGLAFQHLEQLARQRVAPRQRQPPRLLLLQPHIVVQEVQQVAHAWGRRGAARDAEVRPGLPARRRVAGGTSWSGLLGGAPGLH
jgi:hypothetical protein